MPLLNLKPAHKSVQDYYKVLGQYGQLNIDHEMAVRSAFQGLLRTCAKQFDWTLVPEYPVRRTKQVPLKVDGALLDTFRLTHGFWEAKDERDELEREVERKLSLGYPDKNIIFQSPRNAILIQRGRLAWKNTIVDPEALVEVLHQFFDYSDPEILGWQEAADRFKLEVPEQSRALKELIDEQRKKNRPFVEAFTAFVETCRQALNPNLSEDAVERMLIQHLLTERIFSKVFDNEDFRTRNVVAVEIEKVISALIKGSFNRSEFLRRLDPFYKAIVQSAAQTTGYTEKQEFLNTVYQNFFQAVSPKEADTHGIVYTPQPIVDFMVRSVEDILEKEFGKSLADQGVHILDPFVGTGNFITRVMKEIAAKKKSALPYKYREELHCNEVMLLPYYIASMNIEHEYLDAMDEYEPFPGICLVDTFDMKRQGVHGFVEKNVERIENQRAQNIFVIVGNPPYNAGQISENDNNKNRKYEELDLRIRDTYVKTSQATNKNALSDPYVKAIRWASDRIGPRDEGVIALVTNNGFLDAVAADGMRKNLAGEFDAIYVLDLGGNVRRNPKLSGTTHNVFGIQVGVSINFFVRRRIEKIEKRVCEIRYARTDGFWTKEQKYDFLDSAEQRSSVKWIRLEPDPKFSWLCDGLEQEFRSFPPLGSFEAKQVNADNGVVFSLYSRGAETTRDAWNYNYSQQTLTKNIGRLVDTYNAEVSRWLRAKRPADELDSFLISDETKIKWCSKLKQSLLSGTFACLDSGAVKSAIYRPFTKQSLYFEDLLTHRRGRLAEFFPTPQTERENRLLWIKVGSDWPMFALATNCIPDLLPQGGSQCFAFYTYDKDGTNRRENITDWALEQFRSHYGDRSITKWDIFHYVYAVLHHPVYRERYAANLKRELPRIPFVGSSASSAPSAVQCFRAFVTAGQRLADLHVNYEKQPEAALAWLENPQAKLNYRAEKMRLSKDKSTLFYNEYWTLTSIPADVYEYRLGNRSALEWIVDQYQVSTDKRSGITNDPNRDDAPEYIKRLIGQVIYVSLETVKIVKALPEWTVSTDQAEAAAQ